VKRLVLLLVLLGCMLQCSRTDTNRVITGPRGAPYGGTVAVYMETAQPPPQFVEVAIVQAIGYGFDADLAHVVAALREEAARLGCDAVIRVRVDQGSSQASGTGVAVRTPAT
jgi:hypothetical protein